jgi:HSP20 family protein
MTTFRNVYLEELARIQDRINTLFEQAALTAGYDERSAGAPGTWSPSIDLVESGEGFVLLAELPGVRREDIDLSIEERRLELAGRRQPLAENPTFLRMERSYGPFRRAFEFNEPVDVARVTAAFSHGVLRIELPKRNARREIPVQEAG